MPRLAVASASHAGWTRLGTRTAAVALVSATVITAPSAYAADSWSVPKAASITIKGHGFGHGHGMSQYGAEGAARAGLGFKQIIGFYYPGTTWGTAQGKISVLVSADTSDDLVVLPRSGLKVRETGSGRSWTLPTGTAKRWRLTGSGAKTVVSFRTTTWQQWKTLSGPAEFTAAGAPVSLVTPSGTRAYRGALRSASPTPGGAARDTVNVLSMDNYVRGVVPLEMPASWSPAAVQAQAVAARTYAAYERAHPRAAHYQICDTTSCQVYGGYDAEQVASNHAVGATAHLAVTVEDEPAFTQFSSSSGGWTSAGSVPYLTAREDPYDGWNGNPVHAWTVALTDRSLERKFPKIGNLKQVVVNSRDGHGDWGGRVVSVTLVGADGKVTVSGDALRSALGLRSTWFTFTVA